MSNEAAVLSKALSEVVASRGPSVVRVERKNGTSSGVVWSANRVVTVATGIVGERVEIGVGQRTLEAKVKGVDGSTDLALLEVDEPLEPARLEEATVQVGQLVLRLGRPGQTVRASLGIVSTLGDQSFKSRRGGLIDFVLETDAAQPAGFSGGPVVDLEGRVLGLSVVRSMQGAGALVPTKTVARVVAQLETHGRIRRSYLGLQLQPVRLPEAVRQQTGEELGLLVTDVEQGGPAAQGGIVYGDTVLHLGDDSVKTLDDFYAYLKVDRSSQQVPVTLFRNGQVLTQQVTLGAR